jgi:hypothetical protein
MAGDLDFRITYRKRELHSRLHVVEKLFAIGLCYFISDTCLTSQRRDEHMMFMNETSTCNITTVLMQSVQPKFGKSKSCFHNTKTILIAIFQMVSQSHVQHARLLNRVISTLFLCSSLRYFNA